MGPGPARGAAADLVVSDDVRPCCEATPSFIFDLGVVGKISNLQRLVIGKCNRRMRSTSEVAFRTRKVLWSTRKELLNIPPSEGFHNPVEFQDRFCRGVTG